MKGKIKVGVAISQDHAIGKWPARCAKDDVDSDMIFDIEWKGNFWECRADGVGRRSWLGEEGGYGNGSIFVHEKEGIEIIEEITEYQRGLNDGLEKAAKTALADYADLRWNNHYRNAAATIAEAIRAQIKK